MMKIYKAEMTVLGTNDVPETYVERIIASQWQEVHELMARIARDHMCIITELKIIETKERPFDYKKLKTS